MIVSDADTPGLVHPRPSRRRTVLLATLLVLGLGLTAGAATGLTLELTRHATDAEISAATQAELGSRWQRLPAGTIFPATVSYSDSQGNSVTAARIGIAPASSC